MAGEITLHLIGNLTSDPELRWTQNGLAVANLTIASTPKVWDKSAGEFKDGAAVFMRCSVWRDFAEHVAGSLMKGTRVIASGVLKQREYSTKEGEKRTSMELELDSIGPDLRYATAAVTKTQSGRGSQGSPAAQGGSQASADTPWPATPQAGSSDVWNAPGNVPMDQETPF